MMLSIKEWAKTECGDVTPYRAVVSSAQDPGERLLVRCSCPVSSLFILFFHNSLTSKIIVVWLCKKMVSREMIVSSH